MLLNNLEIIKCVRSSGSGEMTGAMGRLGKPDNCTNSDSTSSIGNNCDITGGEESPDSAGEVESPYKGERGGIDTMQALEEVLPIRRGISRFYNGKSKSFASLAPAASIQDIAKSDNAYTRRRRNLLASSLICKKNRSTPSSPLRSNGGGISKKTHTNVTRTNMAMAVVKTATSSQAVKIITPVTILNPI